MKNNNLSVLFFLKYLLNKIPFYVIQIFLDFSLKRMQTKYMHIFNKIAEKENYSFLIIPIDLPFNFYLIINKNNASLTVERKDVNIQASAIIKAKFFTLIDMFEGKLDGDAAFFSKDLVIEGSTAAIVTLRNVLEGENINIINDLTENLGWFKKYLRKHIVRSINNISTCNLFLNELHEEIVKNCNNDIKYLTKDISELKQDIHDLKSSLLNKLMNKG